MAVRVLVGLILFTTQALAQQTWQAPPPGEYTASTRAFKSSNDIHWLHKEAGRADFNGDGVDDIVIGIPAMHDVGTPQRRLRSTGDVLIIDGTTGRSMTHFPYASGEPGFGYAVLLVPDIDGDAIPELIISNPMAPAVHARIPRFGRAYLRRTNLGDSPDADDLEPINNGQPKDESFGWTLGFDDDQNGDGVEDIFITSRWRDGEDVVWQRRHWYDATQPTVHLGSQPRENAVAVWRPEDIVFDAAVDNTDLNQVIGDLGDDSSITPPSDVTSDGEVNGQDLAQISSAVGQSTITITDADVFNTFMRQSVLSPIWDEGANGPVIPIGPR